MAANPALLEKLAVARLKYNVSELQTRVDHSHSLQPPTRKIYNCVTDDSALTESIADLKRWVDDVAVTMIVPLCTLDALDNLKKGPDVTNVNSRESIRYFERCQSGAGKKPVRGVRLQSPTEMFETWAECEKFVVAGAALPTRSSPPTSPTVYGITNGLGNFNIKGNGFRNEIFNSNANGNGHGNGNGAGGRNRRGSRSADMSPTTPPKWIQGIINCTLWTKHRDATPSDVLLVSNNEDVTAWARVYGLRVVNSDELKTLVQAEEFNFEARKRHYAASQNSRPGNTPASRGGRHFGRGGHQISNSGGRGGGRRYSRGEIREDAMNNRDVSDYSRTRGNHATPPPDFILRGPPRGVARGKGKLWEP